MSKWTDTSFTRRLGVAYIPERGLLFAGFGCLDSDRNLIGGCVLTA